MTIRAATRCAIIGVAIAFLMSLAGQYLFDWLYKGSGMASEDVRVVQRIYFSVQSIFYYGSVLVFLITLHSKQKT